MSSSSSSSSTFPLIHLFVHSSAFFVSYFLAFLAHFFSSLWVVISFDAFVKYNLWSRWFLFGRCLQFAQIIVWEKHKRWNKSNFKLFLISCFFSIIYCLFFVWSKVNMSRNFVNSLRNIKTLNIKRDRNVVSLAKGEWGKKNKKIRYFKQWKMFKCVYARLIDNCYRFIEYSST